MNLRRSMGLVGLLGAFAMSAYAQDHPVQMATARPVKVASAIPYTTIDRRVDGLKQPDQALYDAIGRLDPKRAEELNGRGDYVSVLSQLRGPMQVIKSYDFTILNGLDQKDKALLAYSANEMGIALRRGNKNEGEAYNFFRLAVDLNVDTRIINPEGDPTAPLIALAVSSFNLKRFEESNERVKEYITKKGPQLELAEKIKGMLRDKGIE